MQTVHRITIHRVYRTELKPTENQKISMRKHIGVARFAFNWGLQTKQEAYHKDGRNLSWIELHKILNTRKKTDFPWMYEVSKCAPQEALRDLGAAFNRFFKGHSGFPRFRRKKLFKGSFRLTGKIKIKSDSIQLPRIGIVRLKEKAYVPIDAHICSTTIKNVAERWFVSVLVKERIEIPDQSGPTVGLDMGIKTLATLSDGCEYKNIKVYQKNRRKIRRYQKELSRRKKGSTNWKKTLLKLQREHMRISNIRKDYLHKITTRLTKTKSVLVIEDLQVKGMMRFYRMGYHFSDASLGLFRSLLEYKSRWYGTKLIIADRFYPSSKICSSCGFKNPGMSLDERQFNCPKCGLNIDRDLNASINLNKLAASSSES